MAPEALRSAARYGEGRCVDDGGGHQRRRQKRSVEGELAIISEGEMMHAVGWGGWRRRREHEGEEMSLSAHR